MKLLIIEDEKELLKSIVDYMSNINYSCDTAEDMAMALDKIYMNEYACIILDITLPNGKSGLNILQLLKKRGDTTAIIIISAKHSLDDKINGLNLGADDYLAKPFHLAELKARVEAILRRKLFDGKSVLQLDNLILNIGDRTLKNESGNIDLTKKEYELLLYFISNKNKVVTKEAIVEYLWGNEIDIAKNFDFIYTHIKNLRKKLTDAGCQDYIKSVYGMGYKFFWNN